MARGGKREGAGRKAGAVTQLTRETAQRAIEAGGMMPLDYLIGVMRGDPAIGFSPEKFEAAKAAAPYIHAKLAAVEVSGPDGGPVEMVTRIELVAPEDTDSPGSDTA